LVAHALAISKKSVKLHEFTYDQLEPVNVPIRPLISVTPRRDRRDRHAVYDGRRRSVGRSQGR